MKGFTSLLDTMISRTAAALHRQARPRAASRRPRKAMRPRSSPLDQLEPRLLMTTLYWDLNGASPGLGTTGGTWNLTATNWTTDPNGSSPTQAWVQGSDAVFYGGTGTITLGTGITAASLKFDSSANTLTGSTLTLIGAGVIDTQSDDVINSVIAGSVGLLKTGSGQLTLGGINTYTGGTTIKAGAIQASADTAFGAVPATPQTNITFYNDTAIQPSTFITIRAGNSFSLSANRGVATVNTPIANFDTQGFNLTVPGVISGNGSLAKTGSGTLTLTGTNTYTGENIYYRHTTISQGTLAIGSDAALGAVPATESENVIFNSSGTLRFLGNMTVNANRDLWINWSSTVCTFDTQGFTVTMANTILGTGSLVKVGTGELILTGSNGYQGATNVNAGVLTAVGNGLSTFSSNVVLANASGVQLNLPVAARTKGISGGGALGGNISLGSGDLIVGGYAGAYTFAGAISGSGGLSVVGPTVQTLTGTNTYTGWTYLGGTLVITSNASLGSGPVTLVSGGVLRFGASFTLSSAAWLAFNDTATLDVQGYNVTVASYTDGMGGLIKTGSGTLTLTGTNYHSGGTTLTAGTLAVGADSALGAVPTSPGANIFVTGNATLRFTAAMSLAATRGVDVASGATATFDTQTFAVTAPGPITGQGGVAKASAGTLTLSGANTYAGPTAVSGGTLTAAGGAAVPDVSAVTVANVSGATLNLAADETVGSLTAAGSLAKATVNGFTLSVGSDGTSTTFAGVISGTGGLKKVGAGTLTLTGVNTYSGGTILAGGILAVGADSRLGAVPGASSPANITFSGDAALQYTAVFTLGANRGITIASGATGTIDTQANAVTIGNPVAGAGGLRKTGASTLTLTNTTNSYAGGTTLAGGTLIVSADGALGAAPATAGPNITVSADATLRFGAAFTPAATRGLVVALGATATLDNQTFAVTYPGSVSGQGGVTKIGSGTLTFSGTNTYTGATTVSSGTLTASGGAAIPDASAVTVATGATLALAGTETIGSLAGAGAVALGGYTLYAGADNTSTTYSGVASGAGSLGKTGAGTLTLTGNSTYTGGTVLAGGAVALNADTRLPTAGGVTATGDATVLFAATPYTWSASRAITVNAGATLTLDTQANAVTLGASISGLGTVRKAGTSTLTLSGANTHSGGTTLAGGTLLIGADAALGGASAPLTFAAPATLKLSSTVSFAGTRQVALAAGATVDTQSFTLTVPGLVTGAGSLTKIGTGTLVLTGNNTYSGGTTVSAGVLQAGTGGTSGAVGTGTVVDNGQVKVQRSDAYTLPAVTGSGNVLNAGAGRLTVSSAAGYTGTFTTADGVIAIGAVEVGVRFSGSELTVTTAGSSDAVTVSQPSSLSIVADGYTFSQPVPSAGLFVYARGTTEAVTINSTVTTRTTVDTILAQSGTVTSNVGNADTVSAWVNPTDTQAGTARWHAVGSFINGATKAVGSSGANPGDANTVTAVTDRSLWGANPTPDDVMQGSIGDCYVHATLAGEANEAPLALREFATDVGDGTYIVQYYEAGVVKYLRVSNAFSTGSFNGFNFAYPGASGTIWAMVMEKAWAYFRTTLTNPNHTSTNTYASIDTGDPREMYNALNIASPQALFSPAAWTAANVLSIVQTALTNNRPVVLATSTPAVYTAPILLGEHAYTVVDAWLNSVNGTTYFRLRNPWGRPVTYTDGNGNYYTYEDPQGYITVDFATFQHYAQALVWA